MRDVDVVISGIGANFPQSFNVQDFGRDLLDNKHLPTPTKRWKYEHRIDIQPVVGEVPFGDFDAVFYGMSKRLAKNTDPVSKMGLQRSVEAIIDAGLHPQELKGANVNVYVGCGTNEFEQRAVQSRSALTSEGYTIMGMSRTMFANRISYYFDFKGSSCATDSSWPVVHLHLQSAANAIRQGECDAALVAASHLARLPETSTALRMLGLVNGEGITRSFDENASGSVRSDAVVAFLVQRGDHAKRCYAKVLAAGLDFTGPGSVLDPTMPNPRGMEAFLTNLYRTHDIDPRRIAYLEADGSAHPIRDECELDAFDSALIKGYGRSQPLPVGSVKSNLGHTDAVCGYASICKAIVAMETGTVPATINFSKPNPKIKALAEGRMQVVDANMPLQLATDSVVAVNTLGLSSAVGHTVLQPNPRAPQAPQDPSQHLPRIITLAGRTEDGAREVAKKVLAAPFDTNYYRLVQDAFSANIRGYDYRTYVICPSSGTENIPVTRVEKRPVWFVYSGMGSQWPGMGAELMRIPIFAATIERLHAVLEPKGLHLKNIITDTDPNVFDNILKSFVGISACQIALTNLLTAMNVVPDGIIGHSVGELGCAYADGCLTEEQTILAAWARGVASNEAELVKGMMAAIGWGYKDVLSRLPPSIDVACRNSSTSCTLSGPAEDVTLFVKELSDEGVFAKAVNVSDIAYHSRYIQPAAPFLRERLEQVIPDPKPRSEKWVSTSVPEDQQDSDGAKFCSAHYHTNNLLSPVLFEDGLKKVPAHALAIEIAPHGLLQAILKRALPDAQHVPLTHRGGKDPVHFFFEAIGKMSFGFAAPNVAALYPEVSFPVPRGTQSLAPLVTWQHDEEMDMFKDIQDWMTPMLYINSGTAFMTVNSSRVLPLGEELMLLWRNTTQRVDVLIGTLPVTFTDVFVHGWMPIPSKGMEYLTTDAMRGSGYVEITDANLTLVVQGKAHAEPEWQNPHPLPDMDSERTITLSKEQVYTGLSNYGIEYVKKYQNINSVEMSDDDWLVSVTHTGDWVHFLESVVQIYILRAVEQTQSLQVPKKIRQFSIDPSQIAKGTDVLLRLHFGSGVMVGPGVYVSGFSAAPCPPQLHGKYTRHALDLVLFGETKHQSLHEFLRTLAVFVHDKESPTTVMKIVNNSKTGDLTEVLASTIHAATGIRPRVLGGGERPSAVSLLVTGPPTQREAERWLLDGRARAMVVWSEQRFGDRRGEGLALLAEQKFADVWITLVCRAEPVNDVDVLQLGPKNLSIPADVGKAVLVWRGLKEDSVHGIITALQSQPEDERPRVVFIPEGAPPFTLSERLYADQLARGTPVSILSPNGSWSSWMARPVPRPRSAALSATSLDNVELQLLNATTLGPSLRSHLDYVGVEAGSGRRVMGVAKWLEESRKPQTDPLLCWPVPEGWTASDAATVPYVYALAYHILIFKAHTRKNDSILVREGTSALGQALIRVASQLGCKPIFTTVKDAKDREMLHKIFPQLDPCQVLSNGKNGSFEHRLRVLTKARGTTLVVNTLPLPDLRAALRCVGAWGRLVHCGDEDSLTAAKIDSVQFIRSCGMFLVTGDELFSGTERNRTIVSEAMSRGLREAVVQPIVGAKASETLFSTFEVEDCSKKLIEMKGSSTREQYNPKNNFLVVGAQASAALMVAARLAVMGARHIVAAVRSPPSPAVVQQRQRALRRQHAADLKVLQVCDAAATRRVVEDAAPLQAAVVISDNAADVAVLADALPADVRLVLLSEHGQSVYPMARLVADCNARGRPATCMAAPLKEAVDHLADLLSGALPPVTVMTSENPERESREEDLLNVALPHSALELRALGQAAARCQGGPSVLRLRSAAAPGTCPREYQPLFVLPPLGVLDAASAEQLGGLAAGLPSPVFAVQTTVRGSIRATAQEVVKEILRRQPLGPYNVLGWRLSTVLALEVQRQLEALGRCGKLLLLYGDVQCVRQWAQTCSPAQYAADDLGEPVAGPGEQRGIQVVSDLLKAIADSEPDCSSPFSSNVHIVRAFVEDRQAFNENDPHIEITILATASLTDPLLVDYIKQNSAHTQLAGNEDLRASINNTSYISAINKY